MDACDVVDTSDLEEKESLDTKQPNYYERAWGKNQKVNPERPSALICLSLNNTEDLIPYSSDLSEHTLTSEIPGSSIIPEPLSDGEPNSSQDPICLFSFPRTSLDASSKSRVPSNPIEKASPLQITVDRSESHQKVVEQDGVEIPDLVTGLAPDILPELPLRFLSPGLVPFGSLASLSPLSSIHSEEPAKGFRETYSDLVHSPLHYDTERDQFPSTLISLKHSSQDRQSSSATSPQMDKRHNEGLPPNIDQDSSFIMPLDTDHPSRKYSLRNRSAKQLNPFQYDSRQYKKLLRHIPEAIVRRTLLRDSHYQGHDDDWIESQNAGQGADSQEIDVLINERQQQLAHCQEIFKKLNLTFPSSAENSDLEEELAEGANLGDAQQPRGKKRKRTVKQFPLRVLKTHLQEPHDMPFPAHSLSNSPYHSPRHSPPSPETNHEFHLPHHDHHFPSLPFCDPLQDEITLSKDFSPPSLDSSDKGPSRLRRGPRSDHSSAIMIVEGSRPPESTSISVSDSGLSIPFNRHLTREEKVLRRFLPAGVVKKFLVQDKPVFGRAKLRSDVNRQDHNDIDRRGHGRKYLVSPNSRDPSRYQIKGDTETESDSFQSSSKEIIAISDDTLSEREANIESLERDNECFLDENELQHWLVGKSTINEDVIVKNTWYRSSNRNSNPIDNEPELIDRMLQRTRRVGTVRSRSSERNRSGGRLTGATNTSHIKDSNDRVTGSKKLYQSRLAFERVEKVPKKNNPLRIKHMPPSLKAHSSAFDPEVRREAVTTWPEAVSKKVVWKKRHKHARPDKYQSVYFTRKNGINITSGRIRPFIQVNLNDEEFHASLTPERSFHKPRGPEVRNNHRTSDLIREFWPATNTQCEVYANGSGPLIQRLSLDLDIQPVPAGLTLNREGYIGKGRLFELVTFLNASASLPERSFMPDLFLDPRKSIAEMSRDLPSLFDKLYEASTILLEPVNACSASADMQRMLYALPQLVTYKVLHADEDEANHTTIFISEQIKHLMARIDERLELVSADGHSLDFRSFNLYWLAVELHLRIAYGRQHRSQNEPSHVLNTHGAEEYAKQLMRRLLEYGPDRILKPLQKDGLLFDKTSPDMLVLENWVCLSHTAGFLSPAITPGHSFWRLLESSLELQSNKPDSPLTQSERVWRTVFTINAFCQFSMEGISRALVKVDAHWPIITKALQSIRLNADPLRDNAKPAAILQKRDAYLRLVTARCYLLSIRWKWDTNDTEEMFRELHSIFRSREFGNLLGEPDDFPSFIRDRDEELCHTYSITDTAYGVLLKLVIRAVRNFNGDERSRATKITRLLSLIVPVGATPFSKTSPPLHNDLSKLYNRYTAIYVAIYVDPSEKQIRSRLQQVRRYVNFQTADLDSRMAAIRAMMHISILLRHFRKPLDDILRWASEMIGVLLSEYGEWHVGNPAAESDANRVILLVQTVLGAIRFIMDTSTLDHSAPPMLDEYPDIAYLQVWMPQVLSSSLAKDHRTGLEICSCIQKFLDIRAKVLPLPSHSKPLLEESQESQDDYGECDLDMDDPTLLALFDQSEPLNENHTADLRASEVLNTFSSDMYTCVCVHLGCPYKEIDAWFESWLGFGKILVLNRKKEWDYYIKLADSAWRDIKDPFRRMYVRLRCMLTILKLDPGLYKTHPNDFFRLGLEALLSPKITLEHEYYSLLLCVDRLSHPLLRQMPCTVDPISGVFNLDKTSFQDRRLEFIAKILHNASMHLMVSPAAVVLEPVEALMKVLCHWKEEGVLYENPNLKSEYDKFAQDTIALARSHDILCERLRPCLPKLFP